MNATIDFETIRATVDLRQVIEAELGPPLRHGRWACPIHHGDGPNFAIEPDGRRWRCWTCGVRGDVFDFVARIDGIPVADAARRLGGLEIRPVRRPRSPATGRPASRQYDSPPEANDAAPIRQETRAAWEDPAWQSTVCGIVDQAEADLWSPEGHPALDWLRARGLADHTISRFRLGFVPRDLRNEGISVSRGVTIPWVHPGSWYSAIGDAPTPRWVGCNVRRLSSGFEDPDHGPKYKAITGSERGHGYPFSDGSPGVPAIICEGEFDALIAWQEAGWVANVVTVGGAQQGIKPDAFEMLAASPDWLVLTDHDKAGDEAARKLAHMAPRKYRRLMLPAPAKDLTDFFRSGGDVIRWLRSEWTRFGWA